MPSKLFYVVDKSLSKNGVKIFINNIFFLSLQGPAGVILDIYKNGVVAKDGRLQVGDQITECNGIAITKEMAHERLCLSLKQRAPKVKLLTKLYQIN